jgi:putative endonuclease
MIPGFTSKYDVSRLVYHEETNDIDTTIAREKQIKGWRRSKKVQLITLENREWKDLSEGWYEAVGDPSE